MYCSALLCLIRLAPSGCLPGSAERDCTGQIVWDRCTRNAEGLLTINRGDDPHLTCSLFKVESSDKCNHKKTLSFLQRCRTKITPSNEADCRL